MIDNALRSRCDNIQRLSHIGQLTIRHSHLTLIATFGAMFLVSSSLHSQSETAVDKTAVDKIALPRILLPRILLPRFVQYKTAQYKTSQTRSQPLHSVYLDLKSQVTTLVDDHLSNTLIPISIFQANPITDDPVKADAYFDKKVATLGDQQPLPKPSNSIILWFGLALITGSTGLIATKLLNALWRRRPREK